MSGYSRSTSKGPRNHKHNCDNEYRAKLEHIHHEKTKDNEYFINMPIKKAYHELFDSSVEEYNKGKKPSRQINDYYDHISHSKKHKTYQEMIIQIGDMDHHPNDDVSKAIYHDYAERFQKRYPQMKVIGSYIHVDEETPHMHFDYIPWATYEGKKQHIQISNNRAIQQMGFNNWQEWFADQQQMLVDIMIEHNIEYIDMHNTNRKEDIYVYKEKVKQATKEIQNLESVTAPNFEIPQPEDPFTKKGLTGKETLTIEEHNRIMNQYVDSLNSYVSSLKDNYNNLSKKATFLEAQNESYKNIEESLNDKIRKMNQKQYRQENEKINQELKEWESDYNELLEENYQYLKNNNHMTDKYEATESENKRFKKINEDLNDKIKEYQQNSILKSELNENYISIQQYNLLNQENKTLTDKSEALQEENKKLWWFISLFGLDSAFDKFKELWNALKEKFRGNDTTKRFTEELIESPEISRISEMIYYNPENEDELDNYFGND